MINYEDKFEGKKALITGGLGFIGSNLAIELVNLNADVEIIDSLLPSCGGNKYNIKPIREGVKLKIVDLRERAKIDELVKDKDYIFNLAAMTSHIKSVENPLLDLDINIKSHATLLESCKANNRHVKIIYTGSRSQYGIVKKLPADEECPLKPTDINGINKTAAEQYHLLYYKLFGIKTTSLRLTNTYGPRHQMRDSSSGFLSWFTRKAIDGEEITIYGDGKQLRDFNYIDDVVKALLMCAVNDKADGEAFNIGCGKPTSVIDAAKLIIKTSKSGGLKTIPFPEMKKKIEIGDYYADINKIRKIIGWKPEVPLEEGLKRTIEFYKKNKSHYW